MALCRFTATARDDTDGILARLEQQARKLAQAPGIGRPRAELRPGLRSCVVGSYVIFYRAIPDGIEVIRVLHGRRDIEAIFAEED